MLDVNALAFRDNEVDIEQKLHQILEKTINLRKELFYTNEEEL